LSALVRSTHWRCPASKFSARRTSSLCPACSTVAVLAAFTRATALRSRELRRRTPNPSETATPPRMMITANTAATGRDQPLFGFLDATYPIGAFPENNA